MSGGGKESGEERHLGGEEGQQLVNFTLLLGDIWGICQADCFKTNIGELD